MSGISGRELAQSLCEVRFNMRVLFMSGYTADIIAQRGILAADIVLLEKPFTREALLRKVRAALDSARLTKAASAL